MMLPIPGEDRILPGLHVQPAAGSTNARRRLGRTTCEKR